MRQIYNIFAIVYLTYTTSAAINGVWTSIKTPSGKCLDIHAPDIHKNGGTVQVWDCHYGNNQEFFVDFKTNQIKTKQGKCLDIHGPDANKNGGKVQIWDCHTGPNQKLRYNFQTKRIITQGKCLDIHSPDVSKNGGRVQIWDCHNGPNQKFRINNPNNGIWTPIKTSEGKCYDIHAPDVRRNGGKVQIWSCHYGKNQQFYVDFVKNEIRTVDGKCFDIHSPDIHKNGGKVQIWDCHGGKNQRFSYNDGTKHIKTNEGKCMDIHAPDVKRDGGKVQIWSCHTGPNQKFYINEGRCSTSATLNKVKGTCNEAMQVIRDDNPGINVPESLKQVCRVKSCKCVNKLPQSQYNNEEIVTCAYDTMIGMVSISPGAHSVNIGDESFVNDVNIGGFTDIFSKHVIITIVVSLFIGCVLAGITVKLMCMCFNKDKKYEFDVVDSSDDEI